MNITLRKNCFHNYCYIVIKLNKMSGFCMDDEIEGEIIVLGRHDGGKHFKWFGESVNPMKIKNKEVILPTIEEYMESLDILVKDNHINEGEYKRKTDTLLKIWKAENEEEEEEEEEDDEDEELELVEYIRVNTREILYLDETTGDVYNDEMDIIETAIPYHTNVWTILNSRSSGRSPDLLFIHCDE